MKLEEECGHVACSTRTNRLHSNYSVISQIKITSGCGSMLKGGRFTYLRLIGGDFHRTLIWRFSHGIPWCRDGKEDIHDSNWDRCIGTVWPRSWLPVRYFGKTQRYIYSLF